MPPSQGGRYEGFGSAPQPEAPDNPSWAISSANAPSVEDFQQDPVKALSKGWNLLASVAAVAGRAVKDNVLQPGLEKAMDPSLRATAAGYVAEASRRATEAASGANDWGKTRFGVDVVGSARDVMSGPGSRGQYSSVDGQYDSHIQDSASYHDDVDFFDQHLASSQQSSVGVQRKEAAPSKARDDDDEWKDF